jgi:multidrug resistance efflux pump
LPPGAEVSLDGLIQAPEVVLVPAPIEGTVEVLFVDPGAEVFQGQLLARIRNTTLEASRNEAFEDLERARQRVSNIESGLIAARLELSRAEAEAGRARAEFDRKQQAYNRQQMLYREGATPRLTYEKAQKEFETAKLDFDASSELARQARERVDSMLRDLDNARRQVDERQAEFEAASAQFSAGDVLSPVDGVVIATRAQAGAEVSPEVEDLFQIGSGLSVLHVVVQPEPPILKRLQPKLPALVMLLEWSPEPVEGEIVSVDAGKVLVAFSRPDPAIRPGMNASVRFKLP